MKILEIDETETQLVIKTPASNVARVAMKDDAEEVSRMLAEVLAEAPDVRKVSEGTEGPGETADPGTLDGVEDGYADVKDAIGDLADVVGSLLRSDSGKRVAGILQKLPKGKRKKSG